MDGVTLKSPIASEVLMCCAVSIEKKLVSGIMGSVGPSVSGA